MKFYARLNESNVCIGIAQLNEETIDSKLIEIDNYNQEYLWRRYENGIWSIEKFEPIPPTPQPTIEEQIAELKKDNLILMDVLATMYEEMLAKGTV